MRRLLRVIGGWAAAMLVTASAAGAHPLGNFTVNHLSRIMAQPGAIDVRYVLDQAEIPSFTLDRALDAHGTASHAALQAWADRHALAIAADLRLNVDGRVEVLTPRVVTIAQRAGAGGLPITRFTATYEAALAPGPHQITYTDQSESGRLGWKDVVIGGEREPTDELRAYPNALIGSPRSRTTRSAAIAPNATITSLASDADPDGAAAPAAAAVSLGRMNALSDVLARGAGNPAVVVGALFLAIALGALHALEPGHGKTLLAVSLVGARATRRQALILASALTVAHTAGVLALGLIVLAALPQVASEQIYPWITLGSGLLVTILGARAVAREVRRRLPFAHAHVHEHAHAHPHRHDHVHVDGADHHHHDDHDGLPLAELAHARSHAVPGTAPLTFRSAVIAAVSGNIAPCPAAFVVLLAAIQLHQIAYGLALIVAFSVGLAAVLTALGVAVVRGAGWLVARRQFDRLTRWAPLLTAVVIATVGAIMVGEAFAAQGIGLPVPATVALVLAAVGGYAFAWHAHRATSAVHA